MELNFEIAKNDSFKQDMHIYNLLNILIVTLQGEMTFCLKNV